MRRIKGLIFVAVLAMMVFGLVAAANAATFSDAGNYGTQIGALNALGIVDGYPDGTVKPDQPITRAEFAKIVVMMLGLNPDVGGATTQFSDVTSDHWASGLINVAVGQGIIKGYPDGTFKPDAQVTYAEAITMLVRMLGFGPAMDESAWPSSYLAKAASLGVTDGVKVSANAPANRGDVFAMAFNSLDAKIMKQTGWGTDIVYEESDDFADTILKDKLDVDREGDEDDPVRVTATPRVDSSLDKDQITVDDAGDYDGGTFDVANADLDINAFLGHEVELWLNDDDEVIFIKDHTSKSDIVKGTVDDFEVDGTTVTKLEMTDGKKYKWADDVYAYMNGEAVTNYDGLVARMGNDVSTWLGRSVTIVLEDGKIAFIEAMKGNSVIVASVDVDDEKIKYYKQSESKSTLDLSDNDDYIIIKDGKPATLADIEEGDILRTIPNIVEGKDADDVRYIQVWSQKVTGTVEEVIAESSEVEDYYLVVDGKKYAINGNVYENDYYLSTWCTISKDNNDTIEQVEVSDLEDLIGEKVTLYLWAGIRHIVTDIDVEDDDIYAVLPAGNCGNDDKDGLYFKVINKSGDEVIYEVTDDTSYIFNGIVADPDDPGEDLADTDSVDTDTERDKIAQALEDADYLVRIELDSNGKIDEFEVLVNITDDGDDIRADDDSDRVLYDDKWYALDDSPALFTRDGDDYDDVSWSAMQDTENFTGFVYLNSSDEVKAVVVTSGDVASDADRGIVTAKSKTSDGYKLTILVNGDAKTYETDGDDIADGGTFVGDNEGTAKGDSVAYINKGDIIEFTLNANDEIDEITELDSECTVGDYAYERWEVIATDSKGMILTLSPNVDGETNEDIEVTVVLSNDSDPDDKSYVYDFTDTTKAPKLVEFGDISEGDIVQIFMFPTSHENDGQVQFVKIVD